MLAKCLRLMSNKIYFGDAGGKDIYEQNLKDAISKNQFFVSHAIAFRK